MFTEIDSIVLDLKTNKILNRRKAFNALYDILNHRLTTLQTFLNDDDDYDWEKLFNATHAGIIIQSQKLYSDNKELSENDLSITHFSRMILKLCGSPVNEQDIPFQSIISAVCEVLTSQVHLKYFGTCYLQILTTKVLKPSNDLTLIELDSWKQILEVLFKLMASQRHNFPFMELVTSTKLVIELGCSFSHLSTELIKYLGHLTLLLEQYSEDKFKREQMELLAISYHCCRNIAVEFRYEVCSFTETITKHIHNVFKVDLNEASKEILFKLMDLALIVHHPTISSNRNEQGFVKDIGVWNTGLRNFFYIIEQETNKSKFRRKKQEVSPIFTQFAARLCYLVHWNENVWIETENDEERSSKRVKRANKLQSLIDFAQSLPEQLEFNWKWISIISEVISNYSSALEIVEFHTLLLLLSECQATIEHDFEMYAFTKCCYILLKRDEEFKLNTHSLTINLCNELWHKIAEGTIRVCTSINKQSMGNHILLQLLIRYQKYPSSSFIEDVVKIFLSKSTIKRDLTLQTLTTVLKSFNLDSLPNGKELTKKILSYTFEKSSLSNLTQIISTTANEKLSAQTIAQIGAICCLSKTDVVNYSRSEKLNEEKLFGSNWNLSQQVDYKKEVSEMVHLILLKENERLLIEDEDFIKVENWADQNAKNIDFPTQIKCILDEGMFEELVNVTEFKNKIIDERSNLDEIQDYLQRVIENNELMIHLANSFFEFEALGQEKFEGSFIAKKIDFHMQEIERLFEFIMINERHLEINETHQLLMLVQALFGSSYHKKICLRIRSFELKNCLLWVAEQVDNRFLSPNDDNEDVLFGWDHLKNANMEQRIKFHAIGTLCSYNNFEGVNIDTMVDQLNQIQFIQFDNVEIHAAFNVLKLFGRQDSVPEEAMQWIWKIIIEITKEYHTHQYISAQLIGAFKNIVHMSKGCNEMTPNIISFFSSFGQLCSRQQYNPKVTVEYIQQFKHFHQNYFELINAEDSVKHMYNETIVNFLKSEIFAIKMAAIKCLGFILNSNIEETYEQTVRSRKNQLNIINVVFQNQAINYEETAMDSELEDMDRTENNISSYFQLFSSLFCVNFILRKPIMLEMTKLVLRYKLSETMAQKMFEKVVTFLKCDAMSLMDSNSIVDLISQCINIGINLQNFPWFFTGCKSNQDFFDSHFDRILLAVLKNNCRETENICRLTEQPQKSSILELLPECFSFLIPHDAGCGNIKYEEKAVEMKKKIEKHFNVTELQTILLTKTPKVIGCILENVYDCDKFRDICGFEVEVYNKGDMINCVSFNKCLDQLKLSFTKAGKFEILTYFCLKKEYFNFIEKLLMIQKKRVQTTSLKEHKLLYLLQYCVLVEKLFDYLTSSLDPHGEGIKGFMVREITNFFCFLLLDEKYGKILRETASNFFEIFLKKIVPICANDLKPFLNNILSTLVTICKQSKVLENSFEMKCFSIIEFLVIKQKSALEDEVINLDNFPENPEFNELRKTHLKMKYKKGKFSLVQEIEHFLKIKKRKIEGLLALRVHLAENKEELKKLFENLSSTLGFSEDGEKSLLHKLLRSLVGYARGFDEERALEAVKCLGEIGNYDLSTMVFITEDHQKASIYEEIKSLKQCQETICIEALNRMEMLLLHDNPWIFESASAACYHMLGTVSSEQYKASVYLRPFETKTRIQTLFYDSPKLGKTWGFVKVFRDEEFSTYKTWIKRLAGSMMIFAGDRFLELVSNAQQSFAELMNPLMMQLLLWYNSSSVNEEITEGINCFFAESSAKLKLNPKVSEGSIFVNKLAIRQMLMLVECIRSYCQQHPKSNIAENLQLDYLNIAKSAKHCEAFFTAVLYCELWAEKCQKIDSISYKSSMGNTTFREVMYDALTAIGIHDSSDLLVNPSNQRSLYLQLCNQNWQNLLEHDAAYSGEQSDDYIKLLNDMGIHILAKTLADKDQKLKSNQFECLWRLSNWDVIVENDEEKDLKAVIDHREEFEKFHYLGLKCLKKGDELGLKNSVIKAQKSIKELLQQESLECTNNLQKFLKMSQMLQQIQDFGVVKFKRITDSHKQLLEKWEIQNQFPHDFKQIEPILNQRNSIFDTANIKTGRRTWIPEAIQSNMLFILKESINAGCDSDAMKTIAKMRAMADVKPANKCEMLIMEAQLNFKKNLKLAKHCLESVIVDKEFDLELISRSVAFRVFGEIQADNHADDMVKIDQEYFKKSIALLEKYARNHNKSHLVLEVKCSQKAQEPQQMLRKELDIDHKIMKNICVFYTLAKYYDREYISCCEYITSPDFKNKVKAHKKNTEKLRSFQEIYSSDKTNKDAGRSCVILSKTLEIDKNEINNAHSQMALAAEMSMLNYLRGAINDSSENVLSIFRIISIWLNFKSKLNLELLNDTLLKIPSYKFIVALPQLTVRLNEKNDDLSNKLLERLLFKCSREHPHHTLPLILALVHSNDDTPDPKTTKDEPRVEGAKKLLMLMKNSSTFPPMIIQQMEEMSSVLIYLANKECSKMPNRVLCLKNIHQVNCPTIDIPIMKDGNYKNLLISVERWKPEIESVGGINAPKKISCVCSDGVTRFQLVKGKDDMRQDAVMQQVFNVVNQFLKDNKETNKRHARIRTYKVVPLSRRSGILEWCDDTTPIGAYLVGSKSSTHAIKGAHERYNPTDMKPNECMMELGKFDSKDPKTKEENFKLVCSKIQPVFHQFFYENFKDPGQWFERRLAYTTSVAVSSIVGYVLGIGDRHVQNILIDCRTAEVIHIDFGVAFEQGKILPHRELIPFRLTRDIIAPMGVCGVEGVFRKTCEKTMKILRQNNKTLSTILEVLLYDPMYSWTISVKKAKLRQFEVTVDGISDDTNQDERDSMASRALLRVQAKLKGQADDAMGYSSIEGQVDCLIQKATSDALLSGLFKGWQAYL